MVVEFHSLFGGRAWTEKYRDRWSQIHWFFWVSIATTVGFVWSSAIQRQNSASGFLLCLLVWTCTQTTGSCWQEKRSSCSVSRRRFTFEREAAHGKGDESWHCKSPAISSRSSQSKIRCCCKLCGSWREPKPGSSRTPGSRRRLWGSFCWRCHCCVERETAWFWEASGAENEGCICWIWRESDAKVEGWESDIAIVTTEAVAASGLVEVARESNESNAPAVQYKGRVTVIL